MGDMTTDLWQGCQIGIKGFFRNALVGCEVYKRLAVMQFDEKTLIYLTFGGNDTVKLVARAVADRNVAKRLCEKWQEKEFFGRGMDFPFLPLKWAAMKVGLSVKRTEHFDLMDILADDKRARPKHFIYVLEVL